MKCRSSVTRQRFGCLQTYLLLASLLCFDTLPTAVSASILRYEVSPKGLLLENVSPDCPMIYDNDWWADTPDKNYLWAKASLGQADLRGNIVTRDMWDWQKGYLYTLQQGMEDARRSVAIARRSGLVSVPDPVPGCDQAFLRPQSGKIEDTRIIRSEGSDLIVAEARKAGVTKPLTGLCGRAREHRRQCIPD